jgi:hypothetical protein
LSSWDQSKHGWKIGDDEDELVINQFGPCLKNHPFKEAFVYDNGLVTLPRSRSDDAAAIRNAIRKYRIPEDIEFADTIHQYLLTIIPNESNRNYVCVRIVLECIRTFVFDSSPVEPQKEPQETTESNVLTFPGPKPEPDTTPTTD